MKFFTLIFIFIFSCSTSSSVKNTSTDFNNLNVLQSIHEDSLFVYKNDTLTQKGVEKLEKLGIDRIIVEKYKKVKN